MFKRVGIVCMLGALAWTATAQEKDADASTDKARQGKAGFTDAREALGAAFRFADRDRDGKLSKAELTPLTQRFPKLQFDAADVDKDGFLSQDELRAYGQSTVKDLDLRAVFRSADKNGDQAISKEELEAAFPKLPEQAFAKLDRNGDGKIDRSDAPALPGGATPTSGTLSDTEMFLRALLRKTDGNGDGRVTFEELTQKKPGFPKATFDEMDTNKDGVLTLDDAPRPRATRRGN